MTTAAGATLCGIVGDVYADIGTDRVELASLVGFTPDAPQEIKESLVENLQFKFAGMRQFQPHLLTIAKVYSRQVFIYFGVKAPLRKSFIFRRCRQNSSSNASTGFSS